MKTFSEYLTEAKFQPGDWIEQKANGVYGRVIEARSNGKIKVVSFNTDRGSTFAGKAVIGFAQNWHPAPTRIDIKKVPPKVVKKINDKFPKMDESVKGVIKKFDKMMQNFHARRNIDDDIGAIVKNIDKISQRSTVSPQQRKELKTFSARLVKADLSTLLGRTVVGKLEKKIAPLMKALNIGLKTEVKDYKIDLGNMVRDVKRWKDSDLQRIWNQGKDERTTPGHGQLLKQIRRELNKRSLKL